MTIASATRFSRNDGFGRSSRFYQIPGSKKQYPSVTTILQALNKPALVNWAAKVERESIIAAAGNLWDDIPKLVPKMSREAYLATLQKRIPVQKAHRKELEKAADIGSQAHALIEWNLRNELGQITGEEPCVSDKALWAFSCYETWRKTAELVPRFIEQVVWSHSHCYAGTIDWYGEVNNPDGSGVLMVVGDWKTSRQIWPEALLQAAAYGHALVEMGQAQDGIGGCIVRLPKLESDPDPEALIIPPEKMSKLFDAFLHVLGAWKFLEEQKA